jgi:ParB family chromosome partitioning protein
MDKIKKGLGRGLSSLIGETKVEVQKNQLPVSDLIPNKYQPRKNFDEGKSRGFNKFYKRKRNDTADHS